MSFEVNRRLAARRPALRSGSSVDPVTAGIIRGAFETICYEVATHLGRCASSAIINQSNERNASIMDAHGRLAGLSVGIPQLLFISPMSVRWGLEHQTVDDWGPGDVFVGNDPAAGGGHLMDYNVYAPAFDAEGNVVAVQAPRILLWVALGFVGRYPWSPPLHEVRVASLIHEAHTTPLLRVWLTLSTVASRNAA